MDKLFTLISTVLIVSLAAVGCDSLNSSVDAPSALQVQMKVETGSATAKVTGNSEHENSIEIQEVKLFVDEMELESIDEDSLDFESENFIAELPLDGTPLVLTEQMIPAGLYDEFELEVEKPEDDAVVNDVDFRDETGSYSVVIKGLFNGEEFTFRSSEDFEIELELAPPLDLTDADGSLLVISVDVTSWFTGTNGETLDPKDFNNTEQINENIENSFEAYEDQFDDDDDDDDDD